MFRDIYVIINKAWYTTLCSDKIAEYYHYPHWDLNKNGWLFADDIFKNIFLNLDRKFFYFCLDFTEICEITWINTDQTVNLILRN